MNSIRVVYTTDITGMSGDKEITLNLPKDFCLLCYHDSRQEINRLYQFVETQLEYRGLYFPQYCDYLTIWKIYLA